MSEELMAMIESLVQEHYGTQGLEYLRQRTSPAPTVQVPEGWALVPVEPTPEMLAATSWPGCAATDYEHMLAAAPAPAPVATEDVAQVGGVDVLCHFDAAVDAAKILGRADAAREYGCYTEEKSRIERAMYEIIAKHRRALLTAAPAIANQEARDGR